LKYFRYYYYGGPIKDTLTEKTKLTCTQKIGFYQTSKIEGLAGRTYTLNIMVDGKTYNSTSYMPHLPKIDSVSYIYVPFHEMLARVPTIYFSEPQNERNYYMFQVDESSWLPNQTIIPIVSANEMVWQFSILSDEFLESYVYGYTVPTGVSVNDSREYYGVSTEFTVITYSLTQESYLFFKNMIEQFNNDGGAYKLVPATPPGNISNGALGLFRTSSVKGIHKLIPGTMNE